MNDVLLQQILNEIKEIRSTMATKEDLNSLASKTDQRFMVIEELMATKEDLNSLATKEDLKPLATKEEIQRLKQMIESHHITSIESDEKLLNMILSTKSDINLIHERLDYQLGRIAKTEESIDHLRKKHAQ